ncbi:MAG: hypothetical protein IJ411_00070 [Oscillospiraceae bacterium]|nr:hypothetical protein [Oscillospiraceae bacterium]
MNTYKIKAPKPYMIAHRGVSGLERENTCAAFIAAGNRSYFGIETDVHQTADGKYVIIHDDTTTRVTGKELVVEETELAVLRQLRLFDLHTDLPRGDLCLPTLEEYISICKKYEKVAVLELKNRMPAKAVEEIVEIVADCGYLENTIFISFSLENLIDLRASFPEQPAQYLVSKIDDLDELIETLKKYTLDLDTKHVAVTEEIVAKLHDHGIKVNVWTVDSPEDAQNLIRMGVDFITTNILE